MSFIGNVPSEAFSATVKDTFNGDGSTVDFTLSIPGQTNELEVFVENVQQEPTTAYTVSGTTLTFTSAPVSGTGNIYVVHRGPAVQTVTPPTSFGVNSIYGASDSDTAITFEGSGVTTFDQNGTEAARFDASGNLLVGKTSASVTTVGSELRPDGQLIGVRDGGVVQYLNRTTSDGDIAVFRKDGTTVGSIGANSSQVYVAGTGAGLKYGTANLRPTNGSGATTDNAVALGSSSFRFTDLYLSGGVYLGGTGAANYLDDYEDGNWTPQVTIGGSNVTTSSTNNAYQIIGNYVFIEAVITFASGTNTGSIKITGLPTAVTGTSTFSKGIMTNDFFDNPERYYWYAYTGSQLELRVGGTTQSTGSRDLNGNDVKDNTNLQLYISGWYKTR